jgi:hypothetical protein
MEVEMTDSFLSRWAKRKAEVQSEAKVETKIELEKAESKAKDLAGSQDSVPASQATQASVETYTPSEVESAQVFKGPTMDDVKSLTKESDFSAFVAKDVDPSVQQAAMKTLFSDPHFNVMDGLDIYIDDYSKPDPLPPGMLEKMVQSSMLGLFKSKLEDELESGSTSTLKPTSTSTSNPSSENKTQVSETAHQLKEIKELESDAHDAPMSIQALNAQAPNAEIAKTPEKKSES